MPPTPPRPAYPYYFTRQVPRHDCALPEGVGHCDQRIVEDLGQIPNADYRLVEDLAAADGVVICRLCGKCLALDADELAELADSVALSRRVNGGYRVRQADLDAANGHTEHGGSS
jgi:hypothetical protein